MKYFSCLKSLYLFLLLSKILAMESDDCIVIERKSFEVLHIDPHLTMTAAEEHSLQELKNNLKYRRLNQYQVDKIFSTAAFSNF